MACDFRVQGLPLDCRLPRRGCVCQGRLNCSETWCSKSLSPSHPNHSPASPSGTLAAPLPFSSMESHRCVPHRMDSISTSLGNPLRCIHRAKSRPLFAKGIVHPKPSPHGPNTQPLSPPSCSCSSSSSSSSDWATIDTSAHSAIPADENLCRRGTKPCPGLPRGRWRAGRDVNIWNRRRESTPRQNSLPFSPAQQGTSPRLQRTTSTHDARTLAPPAGGRMPLLAPPTGSFAPASLPPSPGVGNSRVHSVGQKNELPLGEQTIGPFECDPGQAIGGCGAAPGRS